MGDGFINIAARSSLHKRIKVAAAQEGMSMQKFLAKLMDVYDDARSHPKDGSG